MSISKLKNGEKRKKRNYIVIILLTVVIAALLIFFLGYFKKNNATKINNKSTKAVFERNNNIYTYSVYNDGEITSIGDPKEQKELMTLSPDLKNVAYKKYYEDAANNPVEVKVYDIDNKKTYDVVNDKQAKNITELKWIDNESLMVTSKVNPSSMDYDIYNIKTKEKEKSIKGIILQVINEKEILYSYFSNNKSTLFINDKQLYKVNDNGEEIISASISKDKSKISFITSKYNNSTMTMDQSVYTGNYDDKNKTVADMKKNDISQEVYGDVSFDDKNNVIIDNGEVAYKIEGSFFSKIEPITKESDYKPTEEELVKFKASLKKTFPNEFIQEYMEMDELQIYNIKWFK